MRQQGCVGFEADAVEGLENEGVQKFCAVCRKENHLE
eukprot:CAMPEP_0179424498 /NCGR_PEP_ID=MMETSP0799-20121207/11625_1 /TAXON_ID=46947 /ORGANISM="Geminigera cryophila, Strain CCMP2564" /LENGTH=36 /DNA_ID= /DNA_START= /DNA_END= /DNA_ORIENTATION=